MCLCACVRARLCVRVCVCKRCRLGAFTIYRTLISPYCSSAWIQLFKNGTGEYQETAPQRSRRLFMGTICPSTRARARVRRARVYWKALRAQGGGALRTSAPLIGTSPREPSSTVGWPLSGSDRRRHIPPSRTETHTLLWILYFGF